MYSRPIRVKKGQSGYEPEREGPPPRRAVALGYDPDQDIAPRVLASGRGELAEKIITLAQANGIPIREDPVLAAALADLEIDQAIPPELYAVVAEVLAFVYRLRTRGAGPLALNGGEMQSSDEDLEVR